MLYVLWIRGQEAMKAVEMEMRGTVFPGEKPGVELHELYGLLQPFPPHFHDHYVIGLIMGGRRRMVLRFPSEREGAPNFSGEVGEGDLVVIRPFEVHACESLEGSRMDWKSLRLPLEVVRPALGRAYAIPPILRDETLRESFEKLCTVIKERENGGRQEELLNIFLRALVLKARKRPGVRSIAIPPPFPDILRWLAGRRERPSLDATARHFGVDKFFMLRGFSANFGITPYRCWESMRLERALSLLRNGRSPVDVAGELGFADQSHLTRTFRKVFGMPPGAFRRSERTRRRHHEQIERRKK